MKSLRILVTAAGGDVGQAIIKAIRMSDLSANVDGADANTESLARAFVDQFHTLPKASLSRDYIFALSALVDQYGYNVVIPASEVEIDALSGTGSVGMNDLPLLVQPATWIRTYADKYLCMKALSDTVPLVNFADGRDDDQIRRITNNGGFPCVVKRRRGFGSKSVALAHNHDDLVRLVREMEPAMVMQYISDEHGEYSVGVFRDHDRCEVLPFRRTLGPVGCTWYGLVDLDQAVMVYARRIAIASDLRGAANIQMRKNRDGVFLLEINPRLSSLAAARAAAGFNDTTWWIKSFLGISHAFPDGYTEVRFQRYFSEMVDVGGGWITPASWKPNNIKEYS